MFSTNMDPEKFREAVEMQRRFNLYEARQMRDHWQRKVDELEARDPLKFVSTGNDSNLSDS